MWYIKLILISLIEIMLAYSLWNSLKTRIGMNDQVTAPIREKYQPVSYWLWIFIMASGVFFLVPLIGITLLAE